MEPVYRQREVLGWGVDSKGSGQQFCGVCGGKVDIPAGEEVLSFFSLTLGCTLIMFCDVTFEAPLTLTWFYREFSAFSKDELPLSSSRIHTVMWGLTIISQCRDLSWRSVAP